MASLLELIFKIGSMPEKSVPAISVLSAGQFQLSDLERLLNLSGKIESYLENHRQLPLLNEYILATLFFEPSTRTRISFESAMHRLGGRVISTVGVQFSSLAKGETLHDTLKMIEAYSDICAIRHPEEGASALAARNISIPVINAGDGTGEHPTQALLDLYTIRKHHPLGEKKISVAFVGDIKHGRTIHSLLQLLGHYDVEIKFISPKALLLPDKYRKFLTDKKISFMESENIDELMDVDVAYITRIQEERFMDHYEFEKLKDSYIVDKELVEKCKPSICIMHPLPRLSEIALDVDELPGAVYFEQAENGLYMRMALLLDLLKVSWNA